MTDDGAILLFCITVIPALIGLVWAEIEVYVHRRRVRRSGGVGAAPLRTTPHPRSVDLRPRPEPAAGDVSGPDPGSP